MKDENFARVNQRERKRAVARCFMAEVNLRPPKNRRVGAKEWRERKTGNFAARGFRFLACAGNRRDKRVKKRPGKPGCEVCTERKRAIARLLMAELTCLGGNRKHGASAAKAAFHFRPLRHG